jgi:predicted  nucleic acid-binding Zn-ribbon protein
MPSVERAGRAFAEDTVKESHESFHKAMERVQDYFKGLHQDTFLEEARIRKRLGEIQSKLYFTEDGLRELKLQREAEKLTRELHAIKKRNVQAQQTFTEDREKHADQQRRRHEPKLRIRLVSAAVVRAPAPAAPAPAPSPAA